MFIQNKHFLVNIFVLFLIRHVKCKYWVTQDFGSYRIQFRQVSLKYISIYGYLPYHIKLVRLPQ